jgi:hypothetical protein
LLSAKQIPPGQSGQIEVTVRVEAPGALSKSVTVMSNDPRQPQIALTVKAEVVPEFNMSERFLYFGSVPKGKEFTKEILITVPADKQAKLLSVESTDPAVTARLEPVSETGEKKYKILATLKADAKEGYHFGSLVVKTTSPTTPELKITVRGMVAAQPQTN